MKLTQNVRAEWHTVLLEGASLPADTETNLPDTGLLTDEPELAILTGVWAGLVGVTVTLHETEPPIELSQWEDVAELSVITDGLISVRGPSATEAITLGTSGGPHRLRVSARNRDANFDIAIDDTSECYSIDIWPAALRPSTCIAATSSASQSWKTAAGA